jgi:RHS repeat-associated protein
LEWQNGDIWYFGYNPVLNLGSKTYLNYISYRRGGSISIARDTNSATITSGGRSVSILRGSSVPAAAPPGTFVRVVGPHGITDVRNAPNNTHEFVYPGGVKKFRVFFAENQNIFVNSGGVVTGINGSRITGYQDSKQVAANSTLKYSFTFDTQGRVSWAHRPDGRSMRYQYYSDGKTAITDYEGNVSWDYYQNGQYVGGKDEAGFTTVISRNAQHDVTSFKNERGQTWNIARDAFGNATSVTNPLNQTSSVTYNAWSDPVTSTNALGATSSITYDSSSHPISATNPLGQTVFTATYDANGQPLTVTDALGRTSSMSYDSVTGDLLSTTSPDGLTSSVTYNALGLPTTATAPGNKTTTVEYDTLMRVTKVTNPNGNQTQFTYDINDNLLTVKDPLNRVSTMTYDVLGNVLTSTNPRGDQESYTYTFNNLLKTVTNGRGKTRSYQYTARGELKYSYLPDGTTEFYGYLGDGNLANFTGSGRSQINYSYDNLGRLSIIDYPNMTDTTFTYDAAGRRIAMTDTSGQTSWFYDAAGRLTSLNQAGKVTSYTYNIDGSRATMTQPAGTTTYTYDSYGRPTGITNPFNEVTSFLYDSLGRIYRKTLQPGTYEEYTYDNLDRLSQMKVVSPQGATTRLESYAYNSASEVLSHTVDGVTTSYTYDAASQLINESRPGYNVGYTFDGNGNRLSKTVNGNVENYTYDNGDKLLTQGFLNYSYDAAGRRTVKRQGPSVLTTYVYDDESRLISNGNKTYTYNGLNTRTKMNMGGNITEYHRDGTGVTAPVIFEGERVVTPGVSSRTVAGQPTFMHGGLKDITAQSGPSGSITATRVYDAYGATLTGTGQWSGKFGYGGKFGYQEDGNDLQLLGHRYYDPSTGTFITRDPIKDGRNWYSYCDNNPINRVDADGLKLKIVGGTEEQRARVLEALWRLYAQSPTARRIIQALIDSDRQYEIRIDDVRNPNVTSTTDDFEGSTNGNFRAVINFYDLNKQALGENGEWYWTTIEQILAHELVHLSKPGADDEVECIDTENVIMGELGSRHRRSRSGKLRHGNRPSNIPIRLPKRTTSQEML